MLNLFSGYSVEAKSNKLVYRGKYVFSKKASIKKSKKLFMISNLLTSALFYMLIIYFIKIELMFIPLFIFLYIGFTAGVLYAYFKNIRLKLKNIIPYSITLFIIIGSPIYSSFLGSQLAKHRKSYNISIYTSSNYPSKIVFSTIAPIAELEKFRKPNGTYKGLKLILHKNNIYYFILDEYEVINILIDDIKKIFPINSISNINEISNALTNKNQQLLQVYKDMKFFLEKMDDTIAINESKIEYIIYLNKR